MINFFKKIELDILYTFSAIKKENFLYLMENLYDFDSRVINFYMDNYINHSKLIELRHIKGEDGAVIDFYCVKGFSSYKDNYSLANNILLGDSFRFFVDILLNKSVSRFDILTDREDLIRLLFTIESKDMNLKEAFRKYEKTKSLEDNIKYDSKFLYKNLSDIVLIADNRLISISDLDINLSYQALEYTLASFVYMSNYNDVYLVLNGEPDDSFISNLKFTMSKFDKDLIKESSKSIYLVYFDGRDNKTTLKLKDIL